MLLKLRGCNVAALKVDDIAPSRYAADRTTVQQRKTGRPVKFELTESRRKSVDDRECLPLRCFGRGLITGARGSGNENSRPTASQKQRLHTGCGFMVDWT
jgi:hypothetical protein